MKRALVGIASDPHCPEGRWYPVVAYEFADTRDYYQFYVLTEYGHWRAFAEPTDYLAEIPYRVANELKDSIRAATVEFGKRPA